MVSQGGGAGPRLAQHVLGLIYVGGLGVPQDDVEAAAWFRKAADQGVAAAQSRLGSFYYLGKGVPQDYVEAAKWYRFAADQGNADAQSKQFSVAI